MDLKAIRTSLDCHHQMRNKQYAMIIQLGPPTFFVTFSSIEHIWKPLVNALKHMKTKNKRMRQNEIGQDEVSLLIRDDPVTCARYYRNRINALRQLISHDHKYYGEIEDYFYVIEFQNRGSVHMTIV